jgi:hypothetical protein
LRFPFRAAPSAGTHAPLHHCAADRLPSQIPAPTTKGATSAPHPPSRRLPAPFRPGTVLGPPRSNYVWIQPYDLD